MSDIQSAFLNIHIAVKDRDFLMFLQTDDIAKENPKLVVKRFNSLLFGLNCAPFLLGTNNLHMRKYSSLNQGNVSQFLSDLYMDDSISRKQNEEKDFEFYLFCKSVLKEGSFNLRKWLSNSENLQERINDYEINYFGESEKCKIENKHKILGVSWLIEDYLFDFRDLLKEFIEIENVTKRIILKFDATLFDPLGIIAPAVVKIKLLFQKLSVSSCHVTYAFQSESTLYSCLNVK